jgi:hypothetical protein
LWFVGRLGVFIAAPTAASATVIVGGFGLRVRSSATIGNRGAGGDRHLTQRLPRRHYCGRRKQQ